MHPTAGKGVAAGPAWRSALPGERTAESGERARLRREPSGCPIADPKSGKPAQQAIRSRMPKDGKAEATAKSPIDGRPVRQSQMTSG
jgi:hypothetical protein